MSAEPLASWDALGPETFDPLDDNAGLREAASVIDAYEWFDATPQLQHIRHWAFSLMVNPWAALGAILTRLSGDIPPNVVLPGFDSSAVASLNLFTVLIGASGSGKSDLLGSLDTRFMPRPYVGDPVLETELSTGEGIAARFTYTTRDSKTGQLTFHRTAWQMFATSDEIGQLDSVAAREGNSLTSTLRSAWSGGRLGASTSDAARIRSLPAHSYRVAWIIGCQPGKGTILLNDEAQTTGLTQRMLFVPVRDPHLTADAPDVTAPPQFIRDIHPNVPFPRALGGRVDGDLSLAIRQEIPVDPAIHAELRAERRRLRVTGEGIDGHWNLAKLKVAALLAILHGEDRVHHSWFALADGFMAQSDAARKDLSAALAQRSRKQDLGIARRDVDIEVYKEDLLLRATVNDLVRLAKMHQSYGGKHPDGPCTSKCTNGIAATRRSQWREALDVAQNEQLLDVITVRPANGKESQAWTISS